MTDTWLFMLPSQSHDVTVCGLDFRTFTKLPYTRYITPIKLHQ
uniref:Uncharacterized protein n=1 Tax=Anguilla anguilla TaxID=7936 RepID=A0A0E9VD10_ANGAN